MDLVRLKSLRELARTGTMAAAAESLHLTPSAISQQIAQLEREMDIALTERQGRGVRLTPAGEALAAHTERIMVVLDEARSDVARLKREVAGELRVAAFPSVAAAVMPGVVKALRSAFPRLQIVLEAMEPPDGLAALGSWQADVALIDDLSVVPGPGQLRYGIVPLTDDTLHALLPARHGLAGKAALSIADLRDEDWAIDSASSTYGEYVVGLCRRAGYEPRVNARCKGFEMVSAMVASGASVSIVPGLLLARPVPGAKAVRLRPDVRRRISAAYRRGEQNHPAVTAFLDQLLRATSKL